MKRPIILAAATLAAALLASGAGAVPPQKIYVVNESSVITEPLLELVVPVFQKAVSEDFAPYWRDAQLVQAASMDAVPADGWSIVLRDDADVYGVLGYHGIGPRGPTAFAFIKTSIAYGFSWEVVFTHELFEMIADPWIDRVAWNGAYRLWLMEVGDPVESPRYGYWRNDALGGPVQISDFVTEQWYLANGFPPYDFTRHVAHPQRVLPGGYASYWNGGWVQIDRLGHFY